MAMDVDVEKPLEGLSESELVESVQAETGPEVTQRALQELSRRSSPRRLEVFRAVLEDPKHDSRIKRTAAVELGTEALPENQELLLSQVHTEDAPLFSRVLQSLGKIGDEEALAQLEQVDPPQTPPAIQALEFARSLMAYRLHLDRHLIARPPDSELVEVTDGIPVEAEAAGPELVREALQEARKDIPALAMTEEGALRVTCQGNELLVVFNADQAEEGQSALPAVLLKKGLSLDRYFLEQYFFTQPAEGGGETVVLGVRPGGQLTFAGSIRESAEGLRFSVRSLDSPYVPAIEVEGLYHPADGAVELTRAISSPRIAARENLPGTPRRATPRFG